MPPNRSFSRRRFLRNGSALAAAAALPRWFVEESRARAADNAPIKSPNARPRLLLVGCGGRGMGVAREAKSFGDIVAVCDVDEKHLASASADLNQATEYKDFRKAIAHKGIDAVICATPDHWHTLVNIHAMRQGKDVYSEKPLTLTIDEGKHVIEAAQKTGRILQTGTQQRSDARFRLTCELVRNGRIGKLKEVRAAVPMGLHEGPFTPTAPPEELDWNLWQGQTPNREYVKERCHRTFRFWYDYAGGTMTDWGAHHNDIALWGMGMERSGPLTIDATRKSELLPGGYTAYSAFRVRYTYASGVEHVCFSEEYDDMFGKSLGEPPAGETRNGVKFIGSNGWIFVSRSKLEASDPDLLKQELPASAERLYASNNHFGNFVECMSTRKPTVADPEIGHRSASVCHLGVISLRLGRKLKWDPQQQEFPGDSEANGYLVREMRKPWSYETV